MQFEIDRAKLESAARYSKAIVDQEAHSTERRVPTLFGKSVEVYLFITGEQSEFAKRMSFAPIRSPSDKSLGGLLDALLKSLEWTNQHAYLGDGGIKFLESIRFEFLSLATLVDTSIEAGKRPVDQIAILDGAKRSVVEQGHDYELIIDGAELISASGQVVARASFTICRFGGYSLVEEPLSALHSAELRRSLVYSAKAGSKTVLFLTDDIVRTVFEMIRKRSEVFFVTGLNATNAPLFECLEDRSVISKSLNGSPYFTAACAAVRCNHFTSEQIQGVDDCGRFLLRWLEQFDAATAEVLLEVIAAHQCVTESHIEQFVSNVSLHKAKAIVFSTKKLADHGGVHRLFTLTQQGQEMIRLLELDSAVSKIANFKGGDETLVVLAETILSGGQLVNNFKRHYLSENKRNGVYIEQQRLFEIEDFKIDFVQGLKRFCKILILSAAFTQRGAERLREYLSTTLDISLGCIEVKGATLEDSACFLAESENISVTSKNALKLFVSNMERIISIFQVEDEAAYARSLIKIDRANLIVRPNSVTKKGLKIFTLPPLNTNIPPLFRETKEHE